MGKYDPLRDWLARSSRTETLTFAEIERIWGALSLEPRESAWNGGETKCPQQAATSRQKRGFRPVGTRVRISPAKPWCSSARNSPTGGGCACRAEFEGIGAVSVRR